jgi:hypothetical protein
VLVTFDASGCVRAGGSATLGSCASDERLKKEIHPFSLGLKEVLGLNPVHYKFNGLGETEDDGKPQLGLIAQDVEKVAPDLIVKQYRKLHPKDKEDSEIKAVKYGALIYAVINSVKDLYHQWIEDSSAKDREIQALKSDNAILKSENAQIKAYLCAKDPDADFCNYRLPRKNP